MSLVSTGGALVKLTGSKMEKEGYGEGSTGRGSLLGTTPHFTRSFSFTEGTAYGKLSKAHRNCFLRALITQSASVAAVHTHASSRLSLC